MERGDVKLNVYVCTLEKNNENGEECFGREPKERAGLPFFG